LKELIEHHYAALELSARLLTHNSATTSIYINLPSPRDWEDRLFNIFRGPNGIDLKEVLVGMAHRDLIRIEESNKVISNAREHAESLRLEHPISESPSSMIGAVIQELGLTERPTFDPEVRFSVWARLFQACNAAVRQMPGGRPDWFLQTIYHGGWGTYYLEFCRLDSGPIFALSEEGHIAFRSDYNALGSLWSDEAKHIGSNFNLRDLAKSQSQQSEIDNFLVRSIRAMHDISPSEDES
jgi:hypothetical protein